MPSVQIGQTITGPENETFTISGFLGRGAFGEVYSATCKATGAVIAVKLLPLGGIGDDTGRRALLNEMKAAREINHPNVVRVLHVDEGTADTIGPYACMEYVSGGTLASLLRAQKQTSGKIPLTRALEMMIDITQGMQAINEKLVHRDIKPDNILIEGRTLKIGDFGISKFIDESTRSQTFKGGQHIAYMAPEGWLNDKNTYKIDVYAVGIVFFEILTSEHPMLHQVKDPHNFLDWQRAHLYEAPPDLRKHIPEVPVSLVQLVARMVAKRPQERPDWGEVLKILSDPAIASITQRNEAVVLAVQSAVASAISKRQGQEKLELERKLEQEELNRFMGLYIYSCEALIDSLNPPVDQFNQSYQYGKITIKKMPRTHGIPGTSYQLPTGNEVLVRLFSPRKNGITVRHKTLIGGGWIGLPRGRSANLVLTKDNSDDLYGQWSICEVKIMALANPRKIIGSYGITEETIEPFGFQSEQDFYEQILYASGGMHIFTYNFIQDVVEHFSGFIADGCR
jgi:serine/threonine protein kinase